MRVVDVYVYRLSREGIRFLLLRRAAGIVYAGQWRMVGGKIERGETAWQAALRELEEETGCRPSTFWSVPSVNAFYEWQHDRINLIPAFAAAFEGTPVLSREHDTSRWFTPEEAAALLTWPEQRRLLGLVAAMLGEGTIPPELRIPAEEGRDQEP